MKPKKFSKILVPVRGIPSDDESVRLACRIARQDKASVLIVYVIEVGRSLPLDAEDLEQVRRAELVLERAEQVAKETGEPIETEMLQAREAGPALVDEAVANNADLIVMGLQYRKPINESPLSTTTGYIMRNASCQVWLCRSAISDEKKSEPG